MAHELSKHGHAVDIFEAGKAPGGELATVDVGGEPVERFYHHLFTHDRFMTDLAHELGVESSLHWHEPRMGFFANSQVHPFTSPLDLLRFPNLSLPARIRMGLATLYLQRKQDYHSFEDITAAQIMPRLMGREAFEKIWQPMLSAKFSSHWDKVSMAWMWARLVARARTRTTNKQRERLGYFKGSFRVVVDALVRANRKHGVSINLSSPVEIISIGEPDAPALRVLGRPVNADAVVATVGLPIIRQLLPPTRVDFTANLSATAYVGACVALMQISRQLSPYYWTNISDRGLPFAALIEHTNLVGARRYGGKHLLYVGNYLPPEHEFFHISDADLIKRFISPIQQVFPTFRSEHMEAYWVSRDPVAQPVIAAGYQRRKPPYKTPIPGFYICNTSQIYPADRGTNHNIRIAREAAAQLHADQSTLTRRMRSGETQ